MDNRAQEITGRELVMTLTADIISAYVSNNSCHVDDLATLITNVYAALNQINLPEKQDLQIIEEVEGTVAVVEKAKPAIHPKRSIGEDYIICLEDGKKFKSLKRHLMNHYGMTPAQYREKWNLSPDYPMVAPSYARLRSNLAKKMGLGHRK